MKKLIDLKSFFLSLILISVISLLLNYFTNNIDQFLVGKFLASSSLGIYNLAIKIVIFPTVNIASIIVRVLFPVLSNYKSNLEVHKFFVLSFCIF